MKLIVKRIDAPSVPGGFAYAVCDERGEMLPMQRRCIVDNGVDRAVVTIELTVDGDTVRLDV